MANPAILTDTAANWSAANPILEAGQLGVEIDVRNNVNIGSGKGKLGDGVTRWSALDYWSPNDADGDVTGAASSTANGVPVWADATGKVLADGTLVNALMRRSVESFSTTATAAETTALTVNSNPIQEFTGSTTQTITLPVVTTLPKTGFQFLIINNSSGALTVNSSGGNLVQSVAAGGSAFITCILLTGTGAASWDSTYIAASAAVTWGTITGTLSDQTDLQTALDAKVSAASNLTDNTIVRGDGGAKGVQTSGIGIDDSDNITGVAALTTTGNVNVGNIAGIPAIYSPSIAAYEAILDTGANGVFRARDTSADNGACFATKPYVADPITSNQNNYNPGGRSRFIELSSDASRDITGIAFLSGNISGEAHFLVNAGTQNIVLKHQDANSTAANQFLNTTGADITLAANQMAFIYYSGASTIWRVSKLN